MSTSKQISRRNFVKAAAIAGASLATVGVKTASAMPIQKPTEWDYTADVIIVGGGGAGVAAACEAVDRGLSVYLLEKEAFLGGSTIISGGQMTFAGTPDQKEKGINDSVDLFTKDLLEVGQNVNDPKLLKAFMDVQLDTYSWLKNLGVGLTLTPGVMAGMSVPRAHKFSQPQLISLLSKHATDKGAKIFTACSGQRLVYDGKKICGVVAKYRDKDVTFEGKKGVILTAGGYAKNPDMLGQYTPAMRNAKAIAGLGNTGDGIKMAQAYGADFIDSSYVKATYGTILNPVIVDQDRMRYHYNGGIIVNKNGKRIADESIPYKLLGDICLALPEGHSYQIYDSEIRDKEHFKTWQLTEEAVQKFENRPDVIYKANTIKEVAKLAGVDPDVLDETVTNYNANVEKGNDPEFGRKTLVGKVGKPIKIDKPPYYIMPTTAILLATYCGVRITPKTEVVDVFGEIIPGLHAAGEMVGGFHGAAYMAGSAVAKAVVLGRIAAKNVAG